jgi:uncharacterized phage protein (TIGR02218 family)
VKVIPSALAAHYAQGSTTVAYGLIITRASDGVVLGFTSCDKDATVLGVLLKSDPGVEVTSLVGSSGLEVGNLELSTLNDGSVFQKKDIFGGLWRNAAYQIFRYNFESPADGVEYLTTGTLGEIRVSVNKLVIELRDLRQYIQQDVGSVSQKTCRYRFGDAKCTMDITAPPLRVTGTVTSVENATSVFTSSARTEAADFFGEGIVKFTSGLNAGMSFKVKNFASGQFTLTLFTFAPIQAGDGYIAIAGCRMRFEEDCRDKYGNELNFGGEPHRRGVNVLTAAP